MNLDILRDHFGPKTTLGVWTVDDKSFGFSCEDRDRGLDQLDSIHHIRRVKVAGETAIPVGRYKLKKRWSDGHKRYVLELIDVPGFQFIQIHSGTDESDTRGCLLPGLVRDLAAMRVIKSRVAEDWLLKEHDRQTALGIESWICVRRDPAAWQASRLGAPIG